MNIEDKKDYEPPVFEEEQEMNFSKDIWEEFSNGKWCFGCTNCNCS